jgi:5-methylcytosine-specific restriction endonuclease McrA
MTASTDWQQIRLQVLERDGFVCQYCGRMNKKGLDVHHIIPRHLGGLDVLNNLFSVCGDKCHSLLELRPKRKPVRITENLKPAGKLKFVSTVSQMGEGNNVIYIPRKYRDKIEAFKGKQIRVVIDDEI